MSATIKAAAKKVTLSAEEKKAIAAAKKAEKAAAEKAASDAIELEAQEKAAAEKAANEASNFSAKLVEALTARNAEQYSKDTVTAINNIKASSKAFETVFAKPEFAAIKSELLKRARIANKMQDQAQFIAVKTVIKIVQAVCALATGLKSSLDPYSCVLGANLNKLASMSNKSNLVALSRSIVFDELETTVAFAATYNCSAGTASSQSGSTRMMLEALHICNVSKGKRGDVMTIQDNDNARAFIALFA